jgi:hypothetical protein
MDWMLDRCGEWRALVRLAVIRLVPYVSDGRATGLCRASWNQSARYLVNWQALTFSPQPWF